MKHKYTFPVNASNKELLLAGKLHTSKLIHILNFSCSQYTDMVALFQPLIWKRIEEKFNVLDGTIDIILKLLKFRITVPIPLNELHASL